MIAAAHRLINIRQSVPNTSENAAASANVNPRRARQNNSRRQFHIIGISVIQSLPQTPYMNAHKVPAGETKLAFTATGKRIQTNIITRA
jgi:hypothetical protein